MRQEVLERALETRTKYSDDTSDKQSEWQTIGYINSLSDSEIANAANRHAVSERFKKCDYTLAQWAWWQSYEGKSESEICAIILDGTHPDFQTLKAKWRSPFRGIDLAQDFADSFAAFQKAAA